MSPAKKKKSASNKTQPSLFDAMDDITEFGGEDSISLPDVRDGLKPVQRRILFTMGQAGMRSDAKHRKCAKVVGDVMGSYHPHGDSSIYEALVRMAQPFSLRRPLYIGAAVPGTSVAKLRRSWPRTPSKRAARQAGRSRRIILARFPTCCGLRRKSRATASATNESGAFLTAGRM